MRSELVALLDHVSHMGAELSADSISHLADRIAELPDASVSAGLSGSTARERALLKRLTELWIQVADVDPMALSLALRSAQITAEDVASMQTVELVWTGPRTEAVPVRRSDQALLEVIESAESELLLVSYAVFNVPRIAKSLSEAVGRGANVRLVLEFEGAQEGDQSYDPLAALGELPREVQVFHWPFSKRRGLGGSGRRGYIHVKCTVADRDLVFISSANLTAYAMQANMELGVVIHGGLVPRRVAEHFNHLIQNQILQRYRRERI